MPACRSEDPRAYPERGAQPQRDESFLSAPLARAWTAGAGTSFQKERGVAVYAWGAWKEGVMRDGMYIVDGDGHVMDFPHRCYQRYLPEQYRRRIAFFPGAQWTRRSAPPRELSRCPNTTPALHAGLARGGVES